MTSTRKTDTTTTTKTMHLLVNSLAVITAKSPDQVLSVYEAVDKLSHQLTKPPAIKPVYLSALQNINLELNELSAVRVNSFSKKDKTAANIQSRAVAFLNLLDLKFEESEAFEKILSYSQARIAQIPRQADQMKRVLNHILTLSTDSKHLSYSEALENIMKDPSFYQIEPAFTREYFDDLLSTRAFYDYLKSQALAIRVHELEEEIGPSFNMTQLEEKIDEEMQSQDKRYKAYVVTQNEKKRNHSLQVQESSLFEEQNIHLSRGVGMMMQNKELPTPSVYDPALTWIQAIILAFSILTVGAGALAASRHKGLFGICGIFKRKPHEVAKTACEETALIHLPTFGLGKTVTD